MEHFTAEDKSLLRSTYNPKAAQENSRGGGGQAVTKGKHVHSFPFRSVPRWVPEVGLEGREGAHVPGILGGVS